MAAAENANPWLLGTGIVLLWVGVWVGVQVLLFDGHALGATIQGAAGGAAFAVVFFYLRRDDAAN